MFKLVLILRYLRRPIGLFPVLAAGMGTYALIVVVAVMSGFGNYIRSNIRGTLSDIVIQANDARGVSGTEELTKTVEAVAGVEAVSPVVSGKALLTVYDSSDAGAPLVRPVVFMGIDLDRERKVGALGRGLIFGMKEFPRLSEEEDTPGMICGREIFYPMREGVRVALTAPTVRDNDVAMSFVVNDYFRSGLSDFDRYTVYIPIDAAQVLLENTDVVTGFHVKVKDGADKQEVKQAIAMALPRGRFTVKTWEETRGQLLAAIALERVVWVAVLGSMLVVAGFAVLAVLAILVLQKTRDIGILRAMGAGVRGVALIFVGFGAALGTLGATLGLACGYLTVRHIDTVEKVVFNWTGYTPWDRNVFNFDRIPCQVDLGQMFIFFGLAVAISVAASIYPAMRAAKMKPVETLRYE